MLKVRSRPGLLARSGGSARAIAASLPAASSANALSTSNPSGITRFDSVAGTMPNGIGLPSGDWSLGMFLKIPTNTVSGSQVILNAAASSSNPYSANNTFSVQYNSTTGTFAVQGVDGSGNKLGSKNCPLPSSNVNGNSLVASHRVWPGDQFLFVVVKSGSFASLWIAYPGHSPIMVADSFTAFGAQTSGFWLGIGRDSSNPSRAEQRNLFKVSYALTKDQIDQIANGVDPTTLGTTAGDDFLFALDTNGTTLTSTINSCTMSRTFNNSTIVTGVGYATQTEAVFLDPLGSHGTVIQHTSGSATVSLSGTYRGASGGDIQAQFIDYNNNAFKGWQTVATSISGNTWSGSISVPKGKRWIKVQLRKVISGVPSTDVMTTTLRWGVGEIVFLGGQSLMEHMASTANPSGSSTIEPNGFTSEQIDVPAQITLANRKQFNVTGTANNGSGLIRVTCSGGHGLERNARVSIQGTGGTTEANGIWLVTPVSRTEFDLQGSTFTNAWTSGGVVYPWVNGFRVLDNDRFTTADGHVIMANAISDMTDSVVCISNQAVGGQAINTFYDFAGPTANGVNAYGNTAVLAAKSVNKVGAYLWLHGHQNIGQTGYFMDSGTWGSETGYGNLGTLYDFMTANFPNSDFAFGVCAFNSIGGSTAATAANIQGFRMAAQRWVSRKGGTTFFAGHYHDLQPRWENGTTQNAHLTPPDYRTQSARLGHSLAWYRGGVTNGAHGPTITAASRSGAVITLTVTQNGGSALRTLQTGAVPSGFEVATDTAFTSKVSISNVELLSSTSIRLTLASDPGATVYVRYMYGMVGDYATSTYMTLRVTGVADNGSGLIRVTMANPVTPATPSGSQRAAALTDVAVNQWVRVANVAGSTQANGYWQVDAKGTDWIDLKGSSSAGLGAFTANSDLYASSATGIVMLELACQIYDDRTIGLVDTNGAPVQPIENYLTAT